MTPPRGKPPAMKALAMLLYAMGNVSFCSIARILGVSDVAALNWVRDEAHKLPEPSTKPKVVVVTLDQIWHFVKKHLLNKIGVEGKTFLTDDWEGYHRLVPESQLFTGKG